MSNTKEEIDAAERIVQECLKGNVLQNSDLELARKLDCEYLMKAMVSVIFSKQAGVNKSVNKKIELTAIGDLNVQKIECAYRAIELPNSLDERRALNSLKKTIAPMYT